MFGSMSDLLSSSGQARKSLSFGTRCGFSILSWSWWWAHLHQTPTSSQHMIPVTCHLVRARVRLMFRSEPWLVLAVEHV